MQIVEKAKSLGREAIALTDHGSISGWIQFNQACNKAGIKPIFGYEAYIVDSVTKVKEDKDRKRYHMTLLAENNDGYKNLLKLASVAYDNFYYYPILDLDILSQNSTGIIALSGCWSSKLQKLLAEDEMEDAKKHVQHLQKIFKDHFYLETQHYDLHTQTFSKTKFLSEKYSIPMVLTCDVHYLQSDQAFVQEILHAIRDRRYFDGSKTIEGAYQWEAGALQSYVSKKFDYDWGKVFQQVKEIADKCEASPEKGHFPVFIPDEKDKGLTNKEIMLKKCKEGIQRTGLKGAGQVYEDRLKRELNLIESKGFIDYILIAADLIQWAKGHGVLVGSGRGSSAGSLACFLLGITSLDPIKYDLLFERFIEETRTDPPDIDTDFEALRRDWVKEYAKQKHGADKVCDVATFAKFKGRNSLDEVGKIYQIPRAKIETIKGYLVERSGGDMRSELTIQDTFDMAPETMEIAKEYPKITDACLLEGQLRHLSVHAAGVLISSRPLQEVLAIYSKKDEEKEGVRSISSFEMRDANELGLIKIDFLGLMELSVLREIYEMANKHMLEIYDIPLDDPETLAAFERMEVEGIFQYEGDSTKSVLRQMTFVDFERLIACLTLSKPGPSHSSSTSRFIARMRGDNSIESFDWHPILAEITSKTYGQIIYQEQIIRVLREFANFSTTDANKIRNLIAKSKGEQEFHRYFPIFEREVKSKIADTRKTRHLWESIKVFGRYAFNRSHAASYALLGYWSMYMKVHHTDFFYICKLNHEKDENKRIRLLREADRKGYKVLPPLLGKSEMKWSKEGEKGLRAGLSEVKGIGEKTATLLIQEKYNGRKDFERKVKGITIRAFKALEECHAFPGDNPLEDFFGIHAYDILNEQVPDRTPLEKIRDWDKAYPIITAGKFIEMNYKDIFEEKISRGHSTDNIKEPDKAKYAMLLLEDETDRCLVHVDRFLFDRIGDKIWDAYHQGRYVRIEGMKIEGWRMIRAKKVSFFRGKDV